MSRELGLLMMLGVICRPANLSAADEPAAPAADGTSPITNVAVWKGGEYSYPHSLLDGGRLYVIVARQKEAIEVLSLALSELHDVSTSREP